MTATVASRPAGAALAGAERTVAASTATAALILLTVVTATSYSRVFEGWDFLWPVLLPALAVHAVSIALRRAPGAIAIPAGGLALVLVSGWVYYGDTLAYGLPSRLTLRTARAELDAAWAEVGTIVPPVPHTAGFGLAAALSLGLAALLADAFAFRGRGAVEATVPAGVVFIAVAAVGVDRNRVISTALWLAASILAAVVLRAMHEVSTDGWIGARTGGAWARWAAGGAALAVVVAGLASVVGPNVPGAGADPLIEHHNKRDRDDTEVLLSPLVDIRDRLRNPTNAQVFTVATDRPAYWRLTGLPAFDGTEWSLPKRQLGDAGGQLSDAPVFSVEVSQQFVIDRLRGAFAPVAYTPVSLQAASEQDLFFIRDTSTLVIPDELQAGTSYDIRSAVPSPTPEALAAATDVDPPDDMYLDLPDGFADRYREVATQAVGGATNPYEQALNLQNWFRANFQYDLEIPESDEGEELDDFLERRTGFCVQFSTAYAAFARTLGLPARVAVGFTPGTPGADGRYIVRERNAHAWPEVWFDGIGWVLFEPTPGRGAPGTETYTGVAPEQDTSPEGTPTTQPSTSSTIPSSSPVVTDPRIPANSAAPTVVTAPGGGTPGADGGGSVPAAVWIVFGLLAALGLWAVLMPRLVANRIAHGDPEAQVAQMWRALVATATLVGVEGLDSRTAIEQARMLADATNIDRGDTLELARAATVAVYSPHGLTDLRLTRSREVSAHLVRAVRNLLPFHRRVLSHLDPRLAKALAGG
jgi:transglutaminase-like putative cysteine protease